MEKNTTVLIKWRDFKECADCWNKQIHLPFSKHIFVHTLVPSKGDTVQIAATCYLPKKRRSILWFTGKMIHLPKKSFVREKKANAHETCGQKSIKRKCHSKIPQISIVVAFVVVVVVVAVNEHVLCPPWP